jgi:hypothetical protein
MSPELAALVSLVKDIATGAAALVAGTVAVLGLKTWRRQLHGQAQYDLARRLLRAVYRARDELQNVRNPLILRSESAAARNEAGLPPTQTALGSSPEELSAVYERRWSRLATAMSDLQLEMTEAEVIFGQVVVDQLDPFRRCVIDLSLNLRHFLRGKVDRPSTFDPDKRQRVEAIVYKISDDPDEDPLTRLRARSSGVSLRLKPLSGHISSLECLPNFRAPDMGAEVYATRGPS